MSETESKIDRCPARYASRLSGFLQRDVYHSGQYNIIEANRLHGRFVHLYAETDDCRVLIPLIERSYERAGECFVDLTMASGYPSPLIDGEPPSSESLENILKKAASGDRHVSAFLRYNPFVEKPFVVDSATKIGSSVVVDLTQTIAERLQCYRKSTRYDINSFFRRGLEIDIKHFHEDDVKEFAGLYRGTMQAVDADADYLFRDNYFLALANSTELRYVLVCARQGNELIAASLFSICDRIMQYHLSGSRRDALSGMSSKAIVHEAGSYGMLQGCHLLNLGMGVSGRDDQLLQFKRGFSPLLRDICVSKHILDDVAYRRLSVPLDQDDASATGFFPVYRQRTA